MGGPLFLVGMRRETRIVGALAPSVVGATGLAEAMNEPPGAIISFGICGSLDPALKVGDLVIGLSVNRVQTDIELTARLMAALPHARLGAVAASDAMAADVAAKARLFAQTGARIVDMESHLAVRSGLPFAVLRAVSDTADANLPHAARVGLKPDGSPDIWAVLKSLARDPSQLPALIRAARDVETAYKVLGNALDLFGPGIGSLDLGQHLVDVT